MDGAGSSTTLRMVNLEFLGVRHMRKMLMDVISQVEPQEKKKTPKGRAKKRITYTRRFVNVTLTGGKRKVSIHAPPERVIWQLLTKCNR
jgi:hypothetical protein